jgi:PIN domain nuclease of toxin-antitoxin system
MSKKNPLGIVLDTHAWIWWVNGSQELSAVALRHIDTAIKNHSVFISAISAWEVALLVERNRLRLTMDVQDWIARTEALPFVKIIAIDVAIALKSVQLLGEFHKDPADRIIVATALRLGLPVISKDEKIQHYPHVKTIW